MIKKKIVFDYSCTQSGKNKYHGANEYAKRILEYLLINLDEEIEEWHILYRLEDHFIEKIKSSKFVFFQVFNINELTDYIRINKINIFYSPLPNRLNIPLIENLSIVITIHGLRQIEVPSDKLEYLYIKTWKECILFLAKNLFKSKYIEIKKKQWGKILSYKATIITPSIHTKYSVINTFPDILRFKENIYVKPSPLRIAISSTNFQLTDEHNQFYLIISANRFQKNAARAILALDNLYSKNLIDKKTIVIGGKTFQKIQNKSRFIFRDQVSETELENLFKSAYCLVYPSLNEGFGYPPYEAMQFGTYVLASSNAAIPEIYSDSILYFNPYLTEEIQNRILQITYDKNLLINLNEKIIQQRDKMIEQNIISLREIHHIILNA
jgi:glycosyltransferase involved in cell wall biosynthesis